MFSFDLNNPASTQPTPHATHHSSGKTETLQWSSDSESDSDDDSAPQVPQVNGMLANVEKLIHQVTELKQKKEQEVMDLIQQREMTFGPRVVKESKHQIASALHGQTPTILEQNTTVEVISHDVGTEGFRWEATCIKHENGKHLIEYNHRYLPGSHDRLTEWILESRVRPVPPEQVILSVALGERVEIKMATTNTHTRTSTTTTTNSSGSSARNEELAHTWRPATVVAEENTEENSVLIHLDRSQMQHTVALEKITFRLRSEWTGHYVESSRLSRTGQSWGWVRWPTLAVAKRSKGRRKRQKNRDGGNSSGGGGGGGLGGKRKRDVSGEGGGGGGGGSSSSSSGANKKPKKKKKGGSGAWKRLSKFRGR